jgi:CubicO group peptidase (beta-lactamase class C family)
LKTVSWYSELISDLPNSQPEVWAPEGGSSAVLVRNPSDASIAVTGAWVGSEDRFAWASVTKAATALACLVAVEEGSVSFSDPIEGYKGVTLAHVLAHAGGIAFDEPTVVIQPGTKRLYSNAGIRLAADHVAAATGMTFRDYIYDGALRPLDMSSVTWADPAAGAYGTIQDLAKLAAELLAPTLIARSTLQLASSVHWPDLDGILPGFGRQSPCPWGLGLEVKGSKSPHWTGMTNSPETFGHFGQSGSLLAIDPIRGVAWCSLSPKPFGPWAVSAWPEFLDAPVFEPDMVSNLSF